MTPTIDVVVPVHGKWELTAACLAALAAQTVPHRVIVVDDASPDDTLDRLREHPEVQVEALGSNRGFAAACNHGIAAGDGDIVVLVNNDVTADPRMLEELVAALGAHPRLGSAAPLLLRPDGRVDSYGLCADVTMAGFVRGVGRTPEEVIASPGHRLLGPYGAVAAFRRAALDEVGLLDEGIFMYGEELDLALRLSAAGWGCAAAPDARGVHLGGGTSGKASATQRRRAGFGRGYLLRAYGVLGSFAGARAVITEVIVCAGDLVLSRDLASLRGRSSGWRAGANTYRRSRSIPGVDRELGFVASLLLRVGDRRG
ncbi:glycosyltransferase family 2 protein [Leifsonia sp. ZF2019]|uniref:glycosyltransferase family 2 protein n=1 Tax=Leifsonia sp. ZF2019 TaxID=2781978 RepID=UPI001CC17179|nr:glycosyltransferase family 2 protein [Leifsonia sp. ZF2019]UAJ80570.1 glycosyltransferase family 2 protein [Leifsonia sp. ZF2019]